MRETKVRINVTVDTALLAEARALKVNVSGVLETGLRETVARARTARWLEENREAIDGANTHLARHGLWSDGKRLF